MVCIKSFRARFTVMFYHVHHLLQQMMYEGELNFEQFDYQAMANQVKVEKIVERRRSLCRLFICTRQK